MKYPLVLSACLLAAGSLPCLAIDPIFVAVGPEINPYGATPCCNDFGSVKMAADGSFVVFWERNESGVRSSWIRRFAADGTPLAAALEVPAESGGLYYDRNRLSSAPDGSSVLLATVPAGPVTETLKAFTYNAQGQAVQAIDVATIPASGATVGHDGEGNFVVLFSDQASLKAARFDAAGNPREATFEVSHADVGYASVQLGVAPDGSFTAFYEKRNNVELDGQLHQRRYDAAGQPLGAEDPVPPVVHLDSQAAMAADGFAAAAYQIGHGAAGRLFDSLGAQGPAFTIWNDPDDGAVVPLIAPLANGDFAAAITVAIDWLQASFFLERIRRDGQPAGPPLKVTTPLLHMSAGALASSGDRIVVLAQRENGEEPFLQIYEATLFADSFESGDLSAWTP